MSLFNKEQVFVLFTERTIRYLTWSGRQMSQNADYGEFILDSLIIEDGRIINLDLLKSMLIKLIEQKKWKRRKISFIVPDNFVTMRQESIPKQLTNEEVAAYIKLHMEGSIRLPFKDPYLDYHLLSEGEETNQIMLFAYPSEHLKPFDQLFEEIGLQSHVADISYLSTYRAYLQADLATRDEHLLMVQWNKYDLTLTVFHQHIPMFSRHIYFSNAPKDWRKDEESKQLEWQSNLVTLPEFVEEQMIPIERFMDFYRYSVMNDEGQINQLLLTGDFPNHALIEQSLSNRFDLPVKKIALPHDLPTKFCSLYGLGLRGERFEL
ncbi:type IV pilus biogenesis protein PilM [Amphibacillus xylanus]|uniref:Pilus assembly protein PilM n=1 Tax=Amphibacillus xylanus (strain ATCC 51415 / DSM 6626 / JCM 7361 / LMG 17667 / NBRC 15112 / Ep01) TaxID=698758 RepID=K0IXH3_AMPXN|nr:pilus assembly protein PilM [Amphibacillus xylanus]BAM47140.1 hypothetical protein AXY_10080 [Amphibacillus xylanus NBRC 15112]